MSILHKKAALNYLQEFRHGLFLSLALLLSVFPILGNAGELLASQILYIDCNGDTNDKSSKNQTVENTGVHLFISDKLGHRARTCFFDGTDYLRIPKNSDFNLSEFTLSAWVRVYETYNGTDTQAIISNYAGLGTAQHYGLDMIKGYAGLFYDDGVKLNGATDTDGTSLNDGNWHHVAMVFKGGNKSLLYVDGTPKRQTSSVAPASISPTGDLYIGRGGDHEGMEKRWLGSMDDIRVLNRAISTEEVKRLQSVIDLPTGELFVPLNLDTGSTESVEIIVTPNPDGSTSLTAAPSGNTRAATSFPQNSTLVLDSSDEGIPLEKKGGITLLDETEATMVARINMVGNLEVIDSTVPEIKLVLQRSSSRFAFRNALVPTSVVRVNHDGTLDIVDETDPDVSTTRHNDRTYTVIDQKSDTTTLVNEYGDAVLKHEDYPNVVALFNVFDSQGGYTLIDLDGNACLQVNADGSVESRTRSPFLASIVGAVGTVIGVGVVSAINVFKNPSIRQTVGAVVSGGAQVLAQKAAKAVAGFSAWLKAMPRLSGFALFGVFENLKNTRSNTRSRVRYIPPAVPIVAGVVVVAAAIALFSYKKMKEEISRLREQVRQLEAEVQRQAARISDLEGEVARQAQTILELQAELAEMDQEIAAQKQQLEEQANRMAQLEDDLAIERELRLAQQAQMEALEAKIAALEAGAEAGGEGVDEIPDGEPIDPMTDDVGTRSAKSMAGGNRVRKAGECSELINIARDILGLEKVEAAFCQLYGVQDNAANDSIFFLYNPEDNTTIQIGEMCEGCDIESMAIHPETNEIYVGSGDNTAGYPNGHLYKLDAATGELRSVGATGFNDISGLTFDKEGKLWAWAKTQGLVKLNMATAQGELVLPSAVELADLTWDAANQAFYGTVGKDLWRYTPADGSVEKLCSNLPPKTEALRVLPSSVLSENLVLIGSHRNKHMKLEVFDVANCQKVVNQSVFVGYDDVEGLDMPIAACQ